MGGLLGQVEEAVDRLFLEMLKECYKNVDKRLSAALETLVISSAQNVVYSLEFISGVLNVVTGGPGFISSVAVLVK